MRAVPIDVPFYASLLETCSARRDISTLQKAHARILTLGLSPHDFLRTKLSAAYARCARAREAHTIFARANIHPTFLFNSIIRCYASLNLHRDSINLYRLMRFHAKPPDTRTISATLRSCAALPSLPLGRQIHASALSLGLIPSTEDAVTNSLISMYAKCGDLSTARRLFDDMSERTLVTYTAMISGMGMHGMAEEGLRLFDEAEAEFGEAVDGAAFAAALGCCARGGLVGEGRRVWEGMGRRGVKKGVEHYTCMVDLLGRRGHVEEAEALIVEGMVMEEGVEPDEAMWAALLGACRVHGRVDVAERVAQRIYG